MDDNFSVGVTPKLEASNLNDKSGAGRSRNHAANLVPPDPPVALSQPNRVAVSYLSQPLPVPGKAALPSDHHHHGFEEVRQPGSNQGDLRVQSAMRLKA